MILTLIPTTIAIVGNSAYGFGLSFFNDWRVFEASQSFGNTPEVNFTTVQQAVSSNSALIIDARSKSEYDSGHIPGAISMPSIDFYRILPDFEKSHNQSTAIIVYCASRHCGISHTIAEKLNEAGYTNVSVYRGGMQEWRERRP